ncbi:MAG: DUF4384 domain-containing protein [Acidobacteria bacterium]|nr:DUF4384 domain-containing protein [Acidobacteriota bacterium]MCI0724728.1 DUF4384 domain-containing protein [Acidobacteriota bacterium]
MFRFVFVLCALALSVRPACGQASDQKISEQQARDLSNMFYTDTLPPKEPAKAEPKKPAVKKAPPKKTPAVNVSSPERRVGLKYRILLRSPDCDIREVDPSYTFHSGDKVRLQIESNVDGYLYVLQKGSTGRDQMLFPDPKINGGDNKITRGIQYSVPGNQWYAFDNNPGIERLTVVVSRTPMKSVQQAAKPSTDDALVSVVSVVEELNQNVRSRDLVLIQEKAPVVSLPAQAIAAPATQSTIVINTREDSNNAVYTEIKLKHN